MAADQSDDVSDMIEAAMEIALNDLPRSDQRGAARTLDLLILQELAHHLEPEPSMTPPPWMRAPASPEKSSHSRGLRGSHSNGSSGATIVPWICKPTNQLSTYCIRAQCLLKLVHVIIGHRLITWMIILALHGPMKVIAPTL